MSGKKSEGKKRISPCALGYSCLSSLPGGLGRESRDERSKMRVNWGIV